MKCTGPAIKITRNSAILGLAAILLVSATGQARSADTLPADTPTTEQLRLGEIMYRKGILPSGEPMQAYVKGDIPAPGTAFSCVSCHVLSGIGSFEGGVNTPPTNGKTLYEPRDKPGLGNNRRNAGMTMTSDVPRTSEDPFIQALPERPAYNDKTLADVLRGGRDPSGRIISTNMPRYHLSDSDMDILIAYLKQLSTDYSPGVSKEFIRFATIVTDKVPADQVKAMMEPLEGFVKSANKQQVQFEAQKAKLREKYLEPTYRRVRLSQWLLKGSPDTWRGQLEEYYRKEPVFAFVAGISPETWEPVYRFTEEHRIPSILPITDPIVAEDNIYNLFFTKGVVQEAEAAAKYLLSHDAPLDGKKIVQVVAAGSKDKTLAETFSRTLTEHGAAAPLTLKADGEDGITTDYLKGVLEREKPDILAIWADGKALEKLAKIDGNIPRTIASSTLLGKNLWTIPEKIRATTYITYPYRLPQDDARFDRLLITPGKKEPLNPEIRMVKSKTYSALRVLTQVLREMRGSFYRDYMMDQIGMQYDMVMPLYERLSFGPEQRYASKGCYMVQLSPGDKPALEKKSEWVIH